MSFRYRHLSPGYIREDSQKLTLNSQFFSRYNEHFEQPHNKTDDIILFPQRIPRLGFFDELYKLESNHWKTEFCKQLQRLKEDFKRTAYLFTKKQTNMDTRRYINVANLCLRYGCIEEVMNLSSSDCISCPYKLELELLKEAGRIDYQLSNSMPVSIDNYFALAEQYLPNVLTSERAKIMLLNQLIVTFYRHQKNESDKNQVFKYAKQFLNLLDKFEQNHPLNQLYCSVGYRGLAMVSEFPTEMQSAFLDKAEKLALNMTVRCTTEEIVYLENKYTCFQSIAKWHHYHHHNEKAEIYLQKMIQIDPYDSTGYSELGFHYTQAEEYENASICFKKAMELGPPGTGMNAYYYAKCVEKLGKQDEAVAYLYKSTELDSQGLSAWIDLLDYYINQHHPLRAQEISKHILNTTILFEQLEKDELIKLQNIIQ